MSEKRKKKIQKGKKKIIKLTSKRGKEEPCTLDWNQIKMSHMNQFC